ncbi:L-methionine sulfoximine N-acetyltransferase [Sphingomonas oligophenolica]|uniref:N-acetyltransferase family protein n=1 Tax=Sphingomonas oligophenolica TaxID=301154 RepID=A0ABU9YA97_9SPHN
MAFPIEISDAGRADLPAILDIYNEVIAHTTAVYSEAPVTLADREAWYAGRIEQGYPILAAYREGRCLGFGSFGDFRAWPCYRHTVEHSVHVHADARGQGIGLKLVEALLERATMMGKHVMVAGIDADNQPSIGLHRRLGFSEVGRFPEVGRKFDRWLDLVFMSRRLEMP